MATAVFTPSRFDVMVLAMDALSVRDYDNDGRLHVSRTPISKATVNPYLGEEIPGWQMLGLQPKKIYRMLRHPDELSRAASTFERLPILSKHIPISAKKHPQELVIGSIGSNVDFSEPYLCADLAFWENQSIGNIEENAVRQLSAAYHYIPDMTPGEYQGMPYDGVMTQITGNHLALVETGRAGADVLVQDSLPPEIQNIMKPTKRGAALILSLSAVSSKIAQDAALPTLVGGVTSKTFNKAEIRKSLLAMDADIDEKKMDTALDGFDDEEKPAQDEDDEDEEDDEEEEGKGKKKKEKPAQDHAITAVAMDAAIERAVSNDRKARNEAFEARNLVRPILGEVVCDSALEIYGLALDQAQVDYAGVDTVAGRKALFNLSQKKSATPPPPIAMDAAAINDTFTKFPELKRFAK